MSELPTRINTRLAPRNYLGRNSYFVTICSYKRQNVFLDAKLSTWILDLLHSESAANSFRVQAYCLMPDHLHFLAEGMDPSSDLRHFLKSFKIKSSRRYSRQVGRALWQTRFYEHILRGPDSVETVAWYIWLNPVRKGLASKPQDYPFVGSYSGKEMPAAWNTPEWRPPWKKLYALDFRIRRRLTWRTASEGGPYNGNDSNILRLD